MPPKIETKVNIILHKRKITVALRKSEITRISKIRAVANSSFVTADIK